MKLFWIFPIAFALAMDAFAVSIGVSLTQDNLTRRSILRLAFFFGFFQFMMPILGWMAGKSILVYIRAVDHWMAFVLLLLIGIKMIYESMKGQEIARGSRADPTRGFSLFILSIATSIDALAVGLSFAVLETSILSSALIIGVVAFFMSLVGARIGPLLGKVIGKWAELAGGVILIFIGIKILIEHLK